MVRDALEPKVRNVILDRSPDLRVTPIEGESADSEEDIPTDEDDAGSLEDFVVNDEDESDGGEGDDDEV